MIEYLGHKINSMYEGEVIKEEVEYIRDNFYKGTKEKALKQMEGIFNRGLVGMGDIHNYYFDEIANDAKRWNCKYSINELLQSDELVQMTYNATKKNKKLFYSEDPIVNFNKKLSLGAGGIAGRVTKFPLKIAIRLLRDYIDEEASSNIYVDPCSGWGTRMIASAVLGLDYVGFEINEPLIIKLQELGKDIQTFKPEWNFHIVPKGSQFLNQSLMGRGNIVMTSPPYFNLEEYRTNSDYDETLGSYEEWLDNFIEPMIYNCSKYIGDNGKILINVKNFSDFNIEKDVVDRACKSGLEVFAIDTLTNTKRVTNDGSALDNSEKVFVFNKAI